MSNYLPRLLAACGLMVMASAFAQVPAAAPSGTTGLCKDGSYSSNATKAGACSGHKGVKTWFGAAASAPAVAAASAVQAPAAVEHAAAKAPAQAKTVVTAAAPVTQAAGGGAGEVWVNPTSKTYHCFGTKYYGKTKQGQYMTEAAAKAAGNHADHGKACGA